MKKYSVARGFTLTEVMIVVAILGIIAAVAMPSYNESVERSRRSDARASLSEAVAMQERVYAETGSYTDDVSRLVVNAPDLSREGYYEISVDVSACTNNCYALTATATGSQVNDASCQTFTVNHLGQKSSLPDSDCW